MNWQSWIALLLVAGAVVWLLRRGWLTVRQGLRGDVTSGCGHCPKRESQKQEKNLIQLGDSGTKSHQRRPSD